MFLITTYDGSKKIGQIELSEEAATIGRDPESAIVLDDSGVSREHARLEPQGNFLLLRDQGSANGTTVNGRPIQAVFLEDSDMIRIGRFELRFKVLASVSPGPVAAPPAVPAASRPPARTALGPEPTRRPASPEADRLGELRRSINGSIVRKFRTLLAVLEGDLPLLHPAIAEDTFEAGLLDEIERTCRDLCEFADLFLELAEMEGRAPREPARRAPASPALLIGRAIGQTSETARSRRILISDRLPRELPLVEADADRLQRAMVITLASLIKLSGDGAILTITAASDERGVRIDFASDEAPALTGGAAGAEAGGDPIARFTSGEVPGAGLSLAIARQIAVEHGGDLLIPDPSREGTRGSCFSLHLPRAAERSPAARAVAEPAR